MCVLPLQDNDTTAHKRKQAAMQTRRMCMLTGPLNSKNAHPICIFFVVRVHAFVEQDFHSLCDTSVRGSWGGACPKILQSIDRQMTSTCVYLELDGEE